MAVVVDIARTESRVFHLYGSVILVDGADGPLRLVVKCGAAAQFAVADRAQVVAILIHKDIVIAFALNGVGICLLSGNGMTVLAIGGSHTFDVIFAYLLAVEAHDIILALFAGTKEHFCPLGQTCWVFHRVVGNGGLVHGAQHGHKAGVCQSHCGGFHPNLRCTLGYGGHYAIADGCHLGLGAAPFYGFVHRVSRE